VNDRQPTAAERTLSLLPDVYLEARHDERHDDDAPKLHVVTFKYAGAHFAHSDDATPPTRTLCGWIIAKWRGKFVKAVPSGAMCMRCRAEASRLRGRVQ
jgi:hypothetical protein